MGIVPPKKKGYARITHTLIALINWILLLLQTLKKKKLRELILLTIKKDINFAGKKKNKGIQCLTFFFFFFLKVKLHLN